MRRGQASRKPPPHLPRNLEGTLTTTFSTVGLTPVSRCPRKTVVVQVCLWHMHGTQHCLHAVDCPPSVGARPAGRPQSDQNKCRRGGFSVRTPLRPCLRRRTRILTPRLLKAAYPAAPSTATWPLGRLYRGVSECPAPCCEFLSASFLRPGTGRSEPKPRPISSGRKTMSVESGPAQEGRARSRA